MTDKSHEARRGLLDAVAGKAKEMTGAVTGNDELTEEGQLQQADAQARKDANSQEAIANAASQQAAADERNEVGDAQQDKRDAHEHAQEAARRVGKQESVEQADAEAHATHEEHLGRERAEAGAAAEARRVESDAADLNEQALTTQQEARNERARLEAEAADAERRAAALRDEAHTE